MYTCEDMHVYRKVLSVRTRKGTTYVSLQNIRSYRNASMIENMYASNKIDVYKGVLSVNARKGKSICEFAQHGFIYTYTSIYAMKYVYLQVCACIQRASKCGLAREETYVSSHNMGSYTKVSIT